MREKRRGMQWFPGDVSVAVGFYGFDRVGERVHQCSLYCFVLVPMFKVFHDEMCKPTMILKDINRDMAPKNINRGGQKSPTLSSISRRHLNTACVLRPQHTCRDHKQGRAPVSRHRLGQKRNREMYLGGLAWSQSLPEMLQGVGPASSSWNAILEGGSLPETT